VEVGRKVGLASSWGEKGAVFLSSLFAVGVAISTTGANNGSIMAGGRAFYAVARSGSVPSFLAKLNSRGAPWTALLAQCIWTLVLLMLPGASFATLLDYSGSMNWAFYALTASSLIVLRVREPEAYRPYKIPLYPLPPLLVIGVAAVILGSSLLREPVFCSLALGFVALSVPFFYLYDNYVSAYPARHSHRLVGGRQSGGTQASNENLEQLV
jgi:amino acid transporter